MTKRKQISKKRLADIEDMCSQVLTFSTNGMAPEDLQRLHQELDCLIDNQRLAPSLVPDAKRLRYYLKGQLQQLNIA